ncbi:MAG: hypothetical protein A3J59_03945 [Candidatus Buchananbacteria bacterium RIFCSPHIGHO2_02_FULL_56_16]|uniref:Uncharacterized protein n=1 Tax=Candidatus Buchananbacteria bacterium RIFCSPHIGHO2_02_FULL_56_16 TaxID=1797542 RepID=A0A1G1YK47_9BACT|nr:MAG: hypothetical protein A3J59_03945 [Candidatus Buchananbacteria bacterium RIFCSPHIGHO2_02_FULL_56_16]
MEQTLSHHGKLRGPAASRERPFLALLNAALLLVLITSVVTSQLFLSSAARVMHLGPMLNLTAQNRSGTPKLSGNAADDAMAMVVLRGVPAVYGSELNVSFDQVEASMNTLKAFDPTYGARPINLVDAALQRYIAIGLKIACEYCCGAKTLVNTDGRAACGCAHSQAMRGLLAYLIQNHGSEYSDDELLQAMARWKGMFFPRQMIAKLSANLTGQSAFTPDTAALVLNVKLPRYGGTAAAAPSPTQVQNLPNMVGGC